MFKKVIIAEDYQMMSAGIKECLKETNIEELVTCNDCNTAWLKIQKALQENSPYELLVTDLNFGKLNASLPLQDGYDLIKKIRDSNLKLFIIVLSIESSPISIKKLMDRYSIDGYILKGKEDCKEMKRAINQIFKNKKLPYLSQEVEKMFRTNNVYELDNYDLAVLQLLIKGNKQKEIAEYLKKNEFKKSSLRSVENRLEELRKMFSATTNMELIAILKDLHLL